MNDAYTPSDAGRTADPMRLNAPKQSQPAPDFMDYTTDLATVFKNLAILSGKPIPAPATEDEP
jgi:hypothetical protein